MPLPLPASIPRSTLVLLAGALAVWIAGCGRSAVDDALEPEARGYLCSACTNRFQTAANVFADQCPRCQSLELLEVVGLVCPADGTLTLAPRGKYTVPCRQCGGATSGIRLPTALDLEAWGAARQTRPSVSRQTQTE